MAYYSSAMNLEMSVKCTNENERMVLERQESLEDGIPPDRISKVIIKNSRPYRRKTSRTTLCDTWRNSLKICLAFGMVFVVGLLVTVLVLHFKVVDKRAWKTAFYEEADSIPGLLCTKCSSFYASKDLTPYKELGTVRVYHVRAAGSYCCVETADELERLKQLVIRETEKMMSYKTHHRLYHTSETHHEIQKPAAHLFLNISKLAKLSDFLQWSIVEGYGTAFVAGGVTYSLRDGKLKVPKSGHYYIYSHVTFRLRKPDPSKPKISSYRHYILRNPHLPKTVEQEIMSNTQAKLELGKNQTYVLQSSDLVVIQELKKDDQVSVGVSDIASVYREAGDTFFGLYRI